MKDSCLYLVAVFESVSQVMKAEKILKSKKISYKIIPVPRNISTDCGVCIRFLPKDRKQILDEFINQVEIPEVHELVK